MCCMRYAERINYYSASVLILMMFFAFATNLICILFLYIKGEAASTCGDTYILKNRGSISLPHINFFLLTVHHINPG